MKQLSSEGGWWRNPLAILYSLHQTSALAHTHTQIAYRITVSDRCWERVHALGTRLLPSLALYMHSLVPRLSTIHGEMCVESLGTRPLHVPKCTMGHSISMRTPPTDDMVCLSQGVIQTSTVLGVTVSYFVASSGVNSTDLGGKLLC